MSCLVGVVLLVGGCGGDRAPRDASTDGSADASADAPMLDAAEDAAGDAGANPEEDCVLVDPTDLTPYARTNLRIHGADLHAFEGQRLRVVTMIHELAPITVAEATITGGAFDLFAADGIVDYTGVGVYIDLDRDTRCDTNEPMHEFTTGTTQMPEDRAITASDLVPSDCMVNGNVGDLTLPATCASANP